MVVMVDEIESDLVEMVKVNIWSVDCHSDDLYQFKNHLAFYCFAYLVVGRAITMMMMVLVLMLHHLYVMPSA